MRTFKRSIANFSFYDNKTIENKLEQMASEGWMIYKAGSFFWTYEKIEPKKLRFAVTYFPGASELDPKPSEKQLDKEDFCSQDGWRLVLRWDAMQIFCTDRDDAVPIETDPVPHVENIHRTMMKKMLTGQLIFILLILWSLFLQVSQLLRDPSQYLSDTSRIFFIPLWLLSLFGAIFQICSYFRWHKRAKIAAKNDIFLPVSQNRWVNWIIVILGALLLLLSYFGSSSNTAAVIVFAAFMAVAFLLAYKLTAYLKKKGFSRHKNVIVSTVILTVFVFAGTACLLAASLGGLLPLTEEKVPVGSYEHNGYVFDIYDDTLPLEVEELMDTNSQWSKEAHQQETFLVSYGEYRDENIGSENYSDYSINYEITDVKMSFLYDFIKNKLINSRQDEINGDTLFIDHFEPIDPGVWNAQEAYQLHWSDSILDHYLVCWENRIVEITFYWTPTQEQIQKAAEVLMP